MMCQRPTPNAAYTHLWAKGVKGEPPTTERGGEGGGSLGQKARESGQSDHTNCEGGENTRDQSVVRFDQRTGHSSICAHRGSAHPHVYVPATEYSYRRAHTRETQQNPHTRSASSSLFGNRKRSSYPHLSHVYGTLGEVGKCTLYVQLYTSLSDGPDPHTDRPADCGWLIGLLYSTHAQAQARAPSSRHMALSD